MPDMNLQNFLMLIVRLVGQSRLKWPVSPQTKHWPDAKRSAFSFSDSLGVLWDSDIFVRGVWDLPLGAGLPRKGCDPSRPREDWCLPLEPWLGRWVSWLPERELFSWRDPCSKDRADPPWWRCLDLLQPCPWLVPPLIEVLAGAEEEPTLRSRRSATFSEISIISAWAITLHQQTPILAIVSYSQL